LPGIHFLDHLRVCCSACNTGVGEAPGIGHNMRLCLVDCKLDRFRQIHPDGTKYLQPRSAIAFALDDIQTDRRLPGHKLARDRSPADHFCTTRLEAELAPVAISDVLCLG